MHEVADQLAVSVIIPTLNEAENLPILIPKIAAALGDRAHEIIIVDDNSRDRTPDVCAELAKVYPLKLIVRTNPTDGLSGAVLEGMKTATGETFVVMDADLQHPPDRITELLATLDGGADFVIGSRYVPGASTDEHWTIFRKLNSSFATALARPFAGRTHDPMSGFFALRKSRYLAAERLTPLGYKIGLELMCKTRAKTVREIPIHFATRARGESKLTLKQQFRYLEHLSRLYDYTFPRASPILKFLIATVAGWAVSLGVFILFRSVGYRAVPAMVISYPFAILMVAVFHLRYVRTQRAFLATHRPWFDFWIVSLGEMAVVSLTAMWADFRLERPADWEVFIISVGCATIMRYILRKELLQDVRGLRRDVRFDDVASANRKA